MRGGIVRNMSTIENSKSKPIGNAKIQAKGKIHLGKRLSLEQSATASTPANLMCSIGLPEDGTIPVFENPMPAANPGELPRQELKYSLHETNADLYIEDNGLTASYGIFGAPGSGKTYLMLYLVRQLLDLDAQDEARKFGALILDPKAALIEDVRKIVATAGRSQDLIVLNANELEANDDSINIIDVDLDAYELARALVLAARSAGVGASEDYWFGAWQNLFSSAIYLLKWLGGEILTLSELLDAVLTVEQSDPLLSSAPSRRRIERLATEARFKLGELSVDDRREAQAAINQVGLFYSQKSDSIATVENLITQAYGEFLRARTRRYSKRIPKASTHKAFYDQVIDE